jgi:hypothetical protein
VFNAWIERHRRAIKTGKDSTHCGILRTFGKDVLPFPDKPPAHGMTHDSMRLPCPDRQGKRI